MFHSKDVNSLPPLIESMDSKSANGRGKQDESDHLPVQNSEGTKKNSGVLMSVINSGLSAFKDKK